MNLFKPKNVAYAHCDLPCGVYDPAQARIEAESVLNAAKKYQESDDASFKPVSYTHLTLPTIRSV